MVLDWRAPLSRSFYRASVRDPQGVAVRRRFGFVKGELTSFEDEHLDRGEELGTKSRILTAEIERPRVGPMRDIVATIQPEQDELVRADLDDSICVQGAPGTGKTAVGLHRAAYLLYLHRERLRRSGVLIVGPNTRVPVLHLGGAAGARRGRGAAGHGRRPDRPGAGAGGDTPAAAALLKHDARMAAVLRQALWARLAQAGRADHGVGRLVPVADRRRTAAPDRRRGPPRGPAVCGRPGTGPGPGGRPAATPVGVPHAATRRARAGCAGWARSRR